MTLALGLVTLDELILRLRQLIEVLDHGGADAERLQALWDECQGRSELWGQQVGDPGRVSVEEADTLRVRLEQASRLMAVAGARVTGELEDLVRRGTRAREARKRMGFYGGSTSGAGEACDISG